MADTYWLLSVPDHADAGLREVLRGIPASLRLVFSLVWQAGPGQTVCVFVLESLSAILAACGLLSVTAVLTALLATGPDADRLTRALPAIVLMVTLLAARQLAVFGAARAQASLRPTVKKVAEARLYEVSVHTDLAAFDDPGFHDAMARARDRGILYVGMATDRLIELVGSALMLLGAAGAASTLHPALLPLLLLSALPSAWTTLRAARIMHDSVQRFSTVHRRMWSLARLLADRQSAPEIRAHTAQETLLGERQRLADLVCQEDIRVGRAEGRGRLVGQAVSGTAVGMTYLVLCWMLRSGVMPLAVTGSAVIAIRSAQSALGRLAVALSKLLEQGLYVQDYSDFLREARSRQRPVHPQKVADDFDRISLDSVTFTYPGKEHPAVADVSMTIIAGQVIALVGENGSGKSTLAKVIAGLYLADRGSVCWGDTNLAQAEESSIYQRLAFIMQAPTQWPFSAGVNITIGRPEKEDPDGVALHSAALRSTADEVVARLGNGYETLLSKEFHNGADLSGGEWQRFSVARGFYRDARVLICDEPSSAMDAKAEKRVFDTIRDLSQGRTTVLITHRLSGVRRTDRIFFMHEGRIVERGTHAELMRAQGRYFELYSLQANAFAS
ncbi:ABC transporter ATP-binding protein [Streptomyces fildesensis]|uniref:ABC transporter ATP-binding protein n=1 Tax=Streptomyces fildesensis TaxID=375757 RepID=A0ABW8C3R3_9ACTN